MSKYLDLAIELAKTSRCAQRHGAILVHRGRILASATNIKLECPTISTWRNNYVHAETAVLGKVPNVPKGARLYVARVDAAGKPCLSAPCKRCYGQISRTAVSAIEWTV